VNLGRPGAPPGPPGRAPAPGGRHYRRPARRRPYDAPAAAAERHNGAPRPRRRRASADSCVRRGLEPTADAAGQPAERPPADAPGPRPHRAHGAAPVRMDPTPQQPRTVARWHRPSRIRSRPGPRLHLF
jgi:hypothetical protein